VCGVVSITIGRLYGHAARPPQAWQAPNLVWWLGAYLALASFSGLWWSYQIRLRPELLGLDRQGTAVLLAVHALCWGLLGACLNAALAVAKHCADRDFDEAWAWWYLAKPPMGALLGVVVYVLSKGFGAFLGTEASITSAAGVAAVAFVGGFATERVVLKIEELAKTIFAVSPSSVSLTVLEPAEGQVVAADHVFLVVQAQGAVSYLRATCLEEPDPPLTLATQGEGLFGARLPLAGAAGSRTIHVAAVASGQALAQTVRTKYAPAGGWSGQVRPPVPPTGQYAPRADGPWARPSAPECVEVMQVAPSTA